MILDSSDLDDAVYSAAQIAVQHIVNGTDEEKRRYLASQGFEDDDEIKCLLEAK